ncbi:hypothetical protein [Ornithinimicrobium sp. INDO-MA30-4]|uniref:hypothetical protein n=1 Tax=Ornithinimicrobium sp. INDO-MA30-4 TaxID=2908651 RepID=UPI001F224663|nr:hypothetical protein [Ornithinimicrobium sp. INDO-MA30-4]UJH71051.1 hypothetical protein L0A91_03900 [Ornithinimicrobium sp. INDO-MA30-4]
MDVFSVTPVPQHRVQQADLPDTELMLRRDLATFTSQLSSLADPAFGKELVEDLARDRMGDSWGLPVDIPRRAERVIELAGSVLALADAGRDPRLHGVDVTSTRSREMLLNRLADRSAAALVVATNVAAMRWVGGASTTHPRDVQKIGSVFAGRDHRLVNLNGALSNGIP